MTLNFEKTRDVKDPIYSSLGAAGIDIFIPNDYCEQYLNIQPLSDIIIPTGLKFDIPKGYALIAFNKSGIALNNKLSIGACVIDEDYTGEVSIHLFNNSEFKVFLKPGQKIMQLILMPYVKATLKQVKSINKQTERGTGGFGSTGLN